MDQANQLGRRSLTGAATPVAEVYDPGFHTVAEVLQHVSAHPELASDVAAAEAAGRNRKTLIEALAPDDDDDDD